MSALPPILTEAILSFLGAGISPETPTWGNIMAEGRAYFQIKPSLIFWPGLLLSIAILSVNLIGDAARDALDPRMKQREAASDGLTVIARSEAIHLARDGCFASLAMTESAT